MVRALKVRSLHCQHEFLKGIFEFAAANGQQRQGELPRLASDTSGG